MAYAKKLSFEKPQTNSPMKTSFHLSIVVATLLGCCSGARASCDLPSQARPTILPVEKCVDVKNVKGAVEYAYDGTGWRSLPAGKQLRAGATIRAAAGSEAILKVDQRSSLVKVSSATTLHITVATPVEEFTGPILAVAGR